MRFGEFVVTIIALVCVVIFMSGYAIETIIISFVVGFVVFCVLFALVAIMVRTIKWK